MQEWLLKWWPVLMVGFNAVIGWIVWSFRRQFVTQDQFASFKTGHETEHEKIDTALARGESEFRVIKNELEHLPTRVEIEETINRALAPLATALKGVEKAANGTQELVKELLTNELAEARQAKAQVAEGKK